MSSPERSGTGTQMRLGNSLDNAETASRLGDSPWGAAYSTKTAAGAAAILEYSLRHPKAFSKASQQAAFDMLCELLEHANDALFYADDAEREEP